MTLKKLALLTAFCLTIVLYGCGGGGGGSNPVATSADPVADTTLQADNLGVFNSYSSMQTALQGNSDPNAQVATFMGSIGSDFTNAAGAPASSSLEIITKDRLTRYTINSYKLIPISHTLVDANTLEVKTYMYLNVVRKAGQPGAVETFSQEIVPSPVVTWKLYADTNTWKIQKGLPFLSSEIPF